MLSFTFGGKRITLGSPLMVLLVVWAFSLAYFMQVKDFSFDAKMFPMFLMLGILCAGVFIIRDNVRVEPVTAPEAAREKAEDVWPSRKITLFIVGIAITIALFVYTVAIVAIIPCTALMLWITGVRNVKIFLTVPAGLALFVYLFFEKWLSVNLPNMFF